MLLNKLLEDGNTLYRHGRMGDALFRYQYALKRLPKKPSDCQATPEKGLKSDTTIDWKTEELFSRLRTHLLLNLARTHRHQGSLDSAISMASQALASDPQSFEALCARARATFDLAKKTANKCMLEQVLGDLRDALKLHPQDLSVHKLIAEVKDTLTREERESNQIVQEASDETG
jgi:tetratricopeptide (TPR) repeat protein